MQLQSSKSNHEQQKQFNACLLCGHTTLTKQNRYSFAHLVKCANCGFVFCKLIPSVDELIAHYNTYHRNDRISPITLKRYEELLKSFSPYLKSGNILDVGCGNGHFLSVAKSNGWNVFGTEYTDTAMAICKSKGIKMYQGKLNPKDFGDIKFDVITSFEVLEHINNPLEEIKNFSTLLNSGGIVYLTTPNFNSLSRYVLKQKWSIIEYPEHLSYYTANTLQRLFNQCEFQKSFVHTTGISLNRFQQATYPLATSHPAINNDESLREKTESNTMFSLAKKIINTLLTFSRKGDTLKAVFVKV